MDELFIQNVIYWFLFGGNMKQPKFCYLLNGFTINNQDCTGCNKCMAKGDEHE